MANKRAYPASSERDCSEESSKRQKVIKNPLKNIGLINPIVQPPIERAPRGRACTSESLMPQTPATIAERAVKKFNNSKRPPGENTLNFHQAPPKMAPLRPVPDFALPTPQQAFGGLIYPYVPSGHVSTDEMDLVKYLEASNYDASDEGIIKRMNFTSFNPPMDWFPRGSRRALDGLPSDRARKQYDPIKGKGLYEQIFGQKEWERHPAPKNRFYHLVDNRVNPINTVKFPSAPGHNESASTGRNIPSPPENEDDQSEETRASASNSS